jgi:hypothetical protein
MLDSEQSDTPALQLMEVIYVRTLCSFRLLSIGAFYQVVHDIGRRHDAVAAAVIISTALFAGLCFVAAALSEIADALKPKQNVRAAGFWVKRSSPPNRSGSSSIAEQASRFWGRITRAQ